ncbi:MAG: 2Fe-2S iron-sulfur cluster binding domain-containing protein [Gemmatimonadetes bacterium]|nr:2Fe-2S iron-sulfur cluster binding domain-containing protein [Gemmatimonadota bacterium]
MGAPTTRFLLNRDEVRVDLPAGTVLLDVLRRERGLTGTKEGCREGDCGACMVLLGEPLDGVIRYRAVNSCLLPLGDAAGRHVVTIEGLRTSALSPAQRAFVEDGATQCGFCTPGFIVSLAGFLLSAPHLTVDAARDALAGNICRCTGYVSIRRALHRICAALPDRGSPGAPDRLHGLIAGGWIPEHFAEAAARLRTMGGTAVAAPAVTGPLVAGGTDLFVQRAAELLDAAPTFLSRRRELQGIRLEQAVCLIGAATTWSDLEDSPLLRGLLPGIEGHLRLAASRPIRHRATVAGNLVNASPIGDLSILLLALGTFVRLSGRGGARELPLRALFTGYKQLALQDGELVTEVGFDAPPEGAVFSFEKVSRRRHLDIASVNSAMLAVARAGRIESMSLSAGGVAPVPLHLSRASAFLAGAPLDAATLRAAMAVAQEEIAPISDVRGSAGYKRSLLGRLLTAHFLRLAPELEAGLLP